MTTGAWIVIALLIAGVLLWRILLRSQATKPPSSLGTAASPTPDIELFGKVAGVTKGRRQSIIASQVHAGDALTLRNEDDNPVDPRAVAVLTRAGQQIGYIEARLAADMRKWQRDGMRIVAEVSEVTGGTAEKRTFGVNIIVRAWDQA